MTILAWIILGLIAGWIASVLVGSGGYGIIGDIVVGMVGAVVGGWLSSQFLGMDVTGLNFTSIVISVVGAVIVLIISHSLAPSHRRYRYR